MSLTKSSAKNKQKKENVSESTICRLVYDRHDVLETQIFNVLLEKTNDKLSDEDLKELKKHFHATVVRHTDGLVTSISSQFK